MEGTCKERYITRKINGQTEEQYYAWFDPVYRSQDFWKLTCSFYKILYKGLEDNVEIALQFCLTEDKHMQVTTKIFRCGSPSIVEVRVFFNYGDYPLWEEEIEEILNNRFDKEENPPPVKAEELVELFVLYQQLFCQIDYLFFRANRNGLLIAFEVKTEGKAIRVKTILDRLKSNICEDLISSPEQVTKYWVNTSKKMKSLLGKGDLEWEMIL